MPVLRYIAWVGAALLAVFFLTDSYLPKAAERAENPLGYNIAIASRTQGPAAVSFGGENRVFPQQVAAADAPQAEPTARVRDALAKLDDTPAQKPVVEQPVQPKKTVKKKVRKPATDYAQDSYGYSQNVAYHRPFDAPFQRSMFW